jgi:hypothetical protein
MALRFFDFRITPLNGDILVRPLTSQAHLWATAFVEWISK